MKIWIASFTARGDALTEKLQPLLAAGGHHATHTPLHGVAGRGRLQDWVKAHFVQGQGLVFVGAAGIAVRAIAPCLRGKQKDPAVLVLDEGGKYVVPLLSGHVGGANALAAEIAQLLGAAPVITTATDLRGLFAVDSWAASQGLRILNPERIKLVSGKILAGEAVSIYSPLLLSGVLPAGVTAGEKKSCDIWIGVKEPPQNALCLAMPALAVGIGCRKGAAKAQIELAVRAALDREGLPMQAIGRVASIDAKAEEAGLLAFCSQMGVPLQTYSAQQLAELPGSFSGSAFVQQVVGVENVCERSALLAGGAGSRLLVGKQIRDGVTVAVAQFPYPLGFPAAGGGCNPDLGMV